MWIYLGAKGFHFYFRNLLFELRFFLSESCLSSIPVKKKNNKGESNDEWNQGKQCNFQNIRLYPGAVGGVI